MSRLRRWIKRLPRRDQQHIAADANTTLYCAHGTQLAQVRRMERLQGRDGGFKDDLAIHHRGIGGASPG